MLQKEDGKKAENRKKGYVTDVVLNVLRISHKLRDWICVISTLLKILLKCRKTSFWRILRQARLNATVHVAQMSQRKKNVSVKYFF